MFWKGYGGSLTSGGGQNTAWQKNVGYPRIHDRNIFRRNSVPSITTLESICNGFGITLSQFFADGDMVELTPQAKELFDNWVTLTPEQKNAVLTMVRTFNHK